MKVVEQLNVSLTLTLTGDRLNDNVGLLMSVIVILEDELGHTIDVPLIVALAVQG